MIKIHVVIDSPRWKNKIKNIKNYFKIKQCKFNTYLNSSKTIKEFTVLLTNNSKMKSLNNKFRGINKPTDVLSFPFISKKDLNLSKKKNTYLGDIAISYEIINFRSKKNNFFIEFDKVWIHGLLHLIGFDHIKNKDFLKMSYLEKKILKVAI